MRAWSGAPLTVATASATSSAALVIVVGSSTATCPQRSMSRPHTGVPTAAPIAYAPLTTPAIAYACRWCSTRIKMPSGIMASVSRARAAKANGRAAGPWRSSLPYALTPVPS